MKRLRGPLLAQFPPGAGIVVPPLCKHMPSHLKIQPSPQAPGCWHREEDLGARQKAWQKKQGLSSVSV